MAVIADISSGNTGFADVMFLVGLILFLLARGAVLPTAERAVVRAHRALPRAGGG
jgi:hypothetical protein